MNRQMTKFGAILCLVAMLSFISWPLYQWATLQPADEALQARTKAAYDAHPELKPAWNIAMHDGVLTKKEAKEILEAVGEKVDFE
jgi:hypothetical protein